MSKTAEIEPEAGDVYVDIIGELKVLLVTEDKLVVCRRYPIVDGEPHNVFTSRMWEFRHHINRTKAVKQEVQQ